MLIKPLTFMNRSGEAVRPVFNFYKIPIDNLLVVHDDLDMALGRLKFIKGGGSGGHKGVRSIITHIGNRDFHRLKIGIGRPRGPVPTDKYVLSPFHSEEASIMEKVLDISVKGLVFFMENGIAAAMNKFNGLRIEEDSVPILF